MIKLGQTRSEKRSGHSKKKDGRVGRTCCLKGECDAVDKRNVWRTPKEKDG